MSISSVGYSSPYAYAGVSASTSASSSIGEPSAKDEFLKFQSKSPAEKMRAMILAKLGVTEEQVKAMSTEDRKKIEDKIQEMIKQQVQNDIGKKGQTGLVADILA
jgi:predicted HTH transcriptional regulator